ncbi:MAG: hypothetical protein GF393_10775 [Armatimonadia bacterium]|nr:hypothetical protein [Armatimonadia bacterium]
MIEHFDDVAGSDPEPVCEIVAGKLSLRWPEDREAVETLVSHAFYIAGRCARPDRTLSLAELEARRERLRGGTPKDEREPKPRRRARKHNKVTA